MFAEWAFFLVIACTYSYVSLSAPLQKQIHPLFLEVPAAVFNNNNNNNIMIFGPHSHYTGFITLRITSYIR